VAGARKTRANDHQAVEFRKAGASAIGLDFADGRLERRLQHTNAASYVASAYWNGKAPYPKDGALAVQWHLKAAVDPANDVAAIRLGVSYRDGRGVERDPQKARYWLGQAVANGDSSAAEQLRQIK
jgi:TPR repeat protein